MNIFDMLDLFYANKHMYQKLIARGKRMRKEDLFEKRCVNRYLAKSIHGKAILYKRNDLYNWAKEAVSRGDKYFYCHPVNENDPHGELELCEPEYRWFTKNLDGIPEDIYNKLILEDQNES